MRSAPEIRIVRNRPMRAIYVGQESVLVAGYRELAPRRLAAGKLVSTLARQAAQRLEHSATSVLAAVARPEDAAAPAYSGQLLDFRRVVACAPHAGPLLDLIFEEAGDAVLLCAGESASFAVAAHAPLTRSLAAHNHRYEVEVAELVTGRDEVRPPATSHRTRSLVVEEKPGKAFVLAPEEATLKQATKRWQQVVKTGEAAAFPGDVAEGWAAAATVLRQGAADGARLRRVASVDLCFPSALVDLRQLSLLFDFAEAWSETLAGVSLSNVKEVCLNVPSAAIAGYMRRELVTRHPRLAMARFDASPFALGWHPVRGLLDALARRDLPLLYLNTADFPVVNLLGCWP